jgi:hypothetical protein
MMVVGSENSQKKGYVTMNGGHWLKYHKISIIQERKMHK